MDGGRLPATVELAERYEDFPMLVTLYQGLGSTSKLKEYMNRFSEQVCQTLLVLGGGGSFPSTFHTQFLWTKILYSVVVTKMLLLCLFVEYRVFRISSLSSILMKVICNSYYHSQKISLWSWVHFCKHIPPWAGSITWPHRITAKYVSWTYISCAVQDDEMRQWK